MHFEPDSELTARAERAEAAIAAVRARCAEREAKGFSFIRIADVLAALDSTDPVEAVPKEQANG